jgi:hypothetical protein
MAKKAGVKTETVKEAFLQAMEKTFGNVTLSCNKVGISRMLPYQWELKDPEFKEKFRSGDYGERFMDSVEAKLAKLGLQDENPTILIFLAKTKCKSRGYVEKTETDHTTGGEKLNTFKIEVTNPQTAEKLNKWLNEND